MGPGMFDDAWDTLEFVGKCVLVLLALALPLAIWKVVDLIRLVIV